MKLNEIKSTTVKPNIAIFRIEDEDGEPVFVQLPIRNGEIDRNGTKFRVHEGDSYRNLTHQQVVLAHFNHETNNSNPVLSFTTLKEDEPVDVTTFPYDELRDMIAYVIETELKTH